MLKKRMADKPQNGETQKKRKGKKMSENNNSTLADITTRGTATKVNYSELPSVAYFRVQSRGATGTLKDLHDRKVGAWAVLVSCHDGKGLRLVSDVGYEYGMKLKGEFKTREEALAAGKKYSERFGKAVERKESRKLTPAEKVAKMTPEEREAFLSALMAA